MQKKILMYLLTQQNGPVRHVVSLYSEKGSGIYTLHPYLKNYSYYIVLKMSQNISLWQWLSLYMCSDHFMSKSIALHCILQIERTTLLWSIKIMLFHLHLYFLQPKRTQLESGYISPLIKG